MPNQPIYIETDGDPKTLLEDLDAHERTGFLVDPDAPAHKEQDGKIASDHFETE